MIAGIFLAVFLPKSYQAETLILIESQKVPSDYVQSLVSSDIESRISTISQQILSRTNLERIIKEFDLFKDKESKNTLIEDQIESLRRRISVDVISDRRRETDAFKVSFKGKDPEKVMRVTNGLASFFINENLKARESQAIGTSDFLQDELETMRAKLVKVEEELKNYREQYMGELPEQLETNLRILDRLQQQLNDSQENLREERGRLALVENQIKLLKEQQNLGVAGQDGVIRPTTLEGLKAQLEVLKTRYTDRHPDVIRMEKQIADFKAEEERATQASTESVEKAPSGANTLVNLEYVRQRDEIKRTIINLEADIVDAQRQLNFYQKRVENTPKREQELLSLRRDYENIKSAYNSLLNRKLESEIAVNMEKKQKGEQFRIIDIARVPEKPSEPDMRKLFLLVLAGGLGIGGGIIFLLEYLDTSFRKPEDIETVLGFPVLATVSTVMHPKDKWRKRFVSVASIFSILLSATLLAGFAALTLIGVEPVVEVIKQIH